MRKAAGYLGLLVEFMIMVTAVLIYLTPHLGWQIPHLGFFTEFLKTMLGFLFGVAVPTFVFITLYVRAVWRFLHEDKTQDPCEITNG